MTLKKIKLLNGPNLNLLGFREPEIYGKTTLPEVEESCAKAAKLCHFDLSAFQTNDEAELIAALHSCLTDGTAGLIINPGAFAHTSIALRDAAAALAIPKVEVHISNIFARESFRHHSYLSGAVNSVITGAGVQGYLLALNILERLLNKTSHN